MRGNPGATTFTRAGNEEPHAFVRADNDRLYVCFFDTRVGSWRWVDQGLPPNARVDSSPIAITSIQMDNPLLRFLHAFIRGNNGHLFENVWNGSRWAWIDHGQPVWNTTIVLSPGVVAYRRIFFYEEDAFLSDSNDQLYAFCWGGDDNLYRYWQDNMEWRPGGRLPDPTEHVVSEPSCIRHPRDAQFAYLYAYVVGSDGHLYTNFSMSLEATKWMWRDLGQPNPSTTVTWNVRPALASFGDGLFAFVRGSDGNLWAHRWAGWRGNDSGTWVDLGRPPGTTVSGPSSVVSYNHEGTDFLYVFVRGADEHLYVHRWDAGASRLWVNFGRPTTGRGDVPTSPGGGNALVLSAPAVVTSRFETTNRMYAFVRASDDNLHVCFWNGIDQWFWTDLGSPSLAPIQLNFHPTSISFGSVPVGAMRTRTLTIENPSGVQVTVSVQAPRPGPFQWGALNAVLAPGDQRAIVVEFNPEQPGMAEATLTVTSNAAGSPHFIGIRGRGIGAIPV